MDHLALHIEAVLFIADDPVEKGHLRKALEESLNAEISKDHFREALEYLNNKYSREDSPIQLKEIGGGIRLMTKPAYYETVGAWLKQTTRKKLSRAAMETLSIIAYKQPVVKSTVEKIRGVNCDYTLQKLLDKELIEITGREEGPGKPLIYATTEKFLNYLGLNNINDLPELEEIEQDLNEIGKTEGIFEEE